MVHMVQIFFSSVALHADLETPPRTRLRAFTCPVWLHPEPSKVHLDLCQRLCFLMSSPSVPLETVCSVRGMRNCKIDYCVAPLVPWSSWKQSQVLRHS